MKSKKYSIVVIIAIIVSGVIWFGLNFRPGSYPYAETYKLNINEQTLINAIDKFKKENSEYLAPKEIALQDGRRDNVDYWYHVYFYLPDKKYIVKCWTRPINNNQTTFAFIAINDGLELGHWKMVNKDFSRKENNELIKNFDERILGRVKKYSGITE